MIGEIMTRVKPSSGLASILVLFLFFVLVGCNPKAVMKPRSEIIEEAREAGVPIASVEEDRARFLERERVQREKLREIVEVRLSGDLFNPSYRIGPGDEIEIRVFDVQELNTTVRVSESGYIDLALIGAVEVNGMTKDQLRQQLRTRLSKYVKNPQVEAFITLFGSQEVSILGEVNEPGRYPLRKGHNYLLEVLSQAGGVTEAAGNYVNLIPAELTGLDQSLDRDERARVVLNRRVTSAAAGNAIEISLQDIFGTSGAVPLEIPVRGGDMVIVPESGRVLVEGEVQQSGSLTLSKRTTLLGALAAAGGITYGAKPDEVELIRNNAEGEVLRFVVNLQEVLNGNHGDVPVRNGDIIRVPSDSGKRMAQDTFMGITRLINFGVGGSVNMAN